MQEKRKKGREINGVLLLDKPKGISSNAALQTVKLMYKARKAGHTGSLDPLATGLLPICFGEATKMSGFLLDSDKEYQTVCKLGVTTTTGDAEGEVLQTLPVLHLSRSRIEDVLKTFQGELNQIPPMYSALKHQGQPLYKLARQGQIIDRKPRRVSIYTLNMLEYSKDALRFEVKCSKGTYVRTLAEDIGQALGCGAHITELRRTAVNHYQRHEMIPLERLQELAKLGMDALDTVLKPVDSALEHWPTIYLDSRLSEFVRRGMAVSVPDVQVQGMVRLYMETADSKEFMGIGHVLEDGRVAPKRLIQAEKDG